MEEHKANLSKVLASYEKDNSTAYFERVCVYVAVCVRVCCSVLQSVAVFCSVLKCVAVC